MSDLEDRPPVFELRRDPIVGRQVLIAEKRALRPNDFSDRENASDEHTCSEDCPFCAGHEHDTPAALLEVSGPSSGWQVRVVPNKYPAVSLDVQQADGNPFGSHEVIIESPHHVRDITELSVEEFTYVLKSYRDRLRHWSTDERIRHCSIFKNVGNPAGASLEHVHSQLVALPAVPPVMLAKLEAAKQFHARQGGCLFCQLLDDERKDQERLVCENEWFIAFCAEAGRQPFETWILPQHHEADFHNVSDETLVALGALLKEIVSRLQSQLVPLSYNLILHTAPFSNDSADYFHWHFELVPRSTRLAGFEWGTGMHINPLSPEQAAGQLRWVTA